MARLIYARRALEDLERLVEFLIESEPGAALETVGLIVEAVGILENHPHIGRPAEQGLRELLVSRGRSGYAVLYGHEPAHDTILILTIRHQREAGLATDDRG